MRKGHLPRSDFMVHGYECKLALVFGNFISQSEKLPFEHFSLLSLAYLEIVILFIILIIYIIYRRTETVFLSCKLLDHYCPRCVVLWLRVNFVLLWDDGTAKGCMTSFQVVEVTYFAVLEMLSTLNMIFSVTYYSELRNVISIYCVCCILPTNVKLVVWTHCKIFTTLLGEKLHQR